AMAKHRRRRYKRVKKIDALPPDLVLPPPERGNHDIIRRKQEPISDSYDRIARPYFVLDLVAKLEEEGRITREMRLVGDAFHDTFRLAQLDQLAAADLTKPRVSGGRRRADGYREVERDAIAEAIEALGGIETIYGSCAFEVLGCEKSLRRWSDEKGF